MITKNLFLQGIFPFHGTGLEKPVPIHSELSHYVPDGVINQTLYFRGGNSSSELITVVLMRIPGVRWSRRSAGIARR